MKIRIFTIPIHGDPSLEHELNSFLSGHRIVSVEKRFVDAGLDSAWTFCVTWTEMSEKAPVRKGKIDYKEVLSEQDFKMYAVLRALRKDMAEKEGVPAYALFTNEQLAEMVRQQVKSKAQLGKIKGIGSTRVEKYGDPFLKLIEAEQEKLQPVTDGVPVRDGVPT